MGKYRTFDVEIAHLRELEELKIIDIKREGAQILTEDFMDIDIELGKQIVAQYYRERFRNARRSMR